LTAPPALQAPPASTAPSAPSRSGAVAAQPAAVAIAPRSPRSPAPPTERQGNAVAVADGLAVTVAALVEGCRAISVAGQNAAVRATDAALALVSIAPRGATRLLLARAPLAGGEPLVVLGHRVGAALTVSPGEAAIRPGERPGVVAALGAGAVASPVLDRSGALVGLVAGDPDPSRRIAGISPLTRHPLIPGADVDRFAATHDAALAGAGPGPERTAGEIAAAAGPLVLPVVCRL